MKFCVHHWAANPDTETQEVLCCDVLLCVQGARPRGARASRRLLATVCAGGGRPNVRTRGARCTRTPRTRILQRKIAPWPLGPPRETPRELTPARERNPTGPQSQSHPGGRGRTAVARCPLPRRSPSLVSPRAVRAISSPRVIHAASPRAVRAISPRGKNAPRTACAHVRTASSSAPSSQQAA